MPVPKMSSHRLALAAALLGAVGVLLVFHNGDDPEPAAQQQEQTGSDDSNGATSPPDTSGDQTTEDNSADDVWDPSTDYTPLPPAPTVAGEPSTPLEPDPHDHGPITEVEVEQAEPPEFDHDFYTDIDDELAARVVAQAWAWVRPDLESAGWTYLDIVEYGAENASDKPDDEADADVVEIGYSGGHPIAGAGVGKIVTVWLELKGSTWEVTGYRDGTVAESDDDDE